MSQPDFERAYQVTKEFYQSVPTLVPPILFELTITEGHAPG
jgi:hypothetical protein